MAVIAADNMVVQARGFGSLPMLRQLGLMVGLALSVALGVTVALWSQAPNYSVLYASLSPKDLSSVTQSLDSAGIEYKLERGTGGILVDAEKIHEARMRLSTTGMPQGGEVGFELLQQDQGLGSNSFLLKARYNRALEGELAQSISRLSVIESARVHLAIPKQSAFARKISTPSASVVVNLSPGRVIDESQTAGIINIVASSVPGLLAENVSVVDDKGRMLSSVGGDSEMNMGGTQFEYTRKLEESYVKRILEIIGPFVGSDGVRAQVVADMDFTSLNETKESYLPDQRVVRSEQIFEQNSNQLGAIGIPGALSNKPSRDANQEGLSNSLSDQKSGNNSSRAIRNYEVDRTISHTRQSPVKLQRLSVAVIIDYRTTVSKKGKVKRKPLKEDELERVSELVKEAVGLNEARGDTLKVVNTPFQMPEAVEPMPELPIWKQAWALSVGKQLLGGLVVLFIAFGVLRPMLSSLAKQGDKVPANYAALPAGQQGEQLALGEDQLTLSNHNPVGGQQLIDAASSMVKDDPKRVAQVLNTWVEKDE